MTSNDYTSVPGHPLGKVPLEALEAARNAYRLAFMDNSASDPDMIEPIADAVLAAALPYLKLQRVLNKDMIHALSKDLTHASSMIDQDRYISIPVWLYKPFAEQLYKMGWRKRVARRKDPEGDPS